MEVDYSELEKEAWETLKFANSYTRLGALLDIRGVTFGQVAARKWWKTFGDEWNCCDNIYQYKDELFDLFYSSEPSDRRLMMSPYERRRHDLLPEKVKVYRGCYDDNRDGFSWTLSKNIAEGFTKQHRYRRDGEDALLLTGTTRRNATIFKSSRREQEMICWDVKVIREELLLAKP